MKQINKFKLLAPFGVSSLLLMSACASPVATGAVLGTSAGAGAGALVGSVIANGDIAASALLGGVIGLPLGLALGMHWQKQTDEAIEMAKMDQYLRNQQDIISREKEIDALRQGVINEAPRELPSDHLKEHLYMGPSLGVPTR